MSRLLATCLLVATACGGDGDAPASDAMIDAPLSCTDFSTAELGRCSTAGGGFCVNLGADNRFEPVASGETVDMVQGFQGSPMIALAVRATGIDGNDGGEPANNPAVVGRVFDDTGLQIASYFNSVPFTDVAGEPGTVEMLSLFLIINGLPDQYAGASVRGEVSVVDRNGELRCGELDFVAGAISTP